MDIIIQKLAPIAFEHGTKYVSQKLANPATELQTQASANNTVAIRSTLNKNPNIDRAAALVTAAGLGHLKALEILLEPPRVSSRERDHNHSRPHEAPDVNVWAQGTTPLLAAIKEHHAKTTKLLLESGAETDLSYKDGTSPLHVAAMGGDLEIARLLIDHDANVNHPNDAGDTALIVASRWGHANTARFLIEKGAKVNARNNKNSTALLVAARHDCIDVLQALLDHGANVNARDKKGRTVLHRAVAGMWLIEGVPVKTKERMVEILLKAGADPNVRDVAGKTAGDRAGWFVGGEGLRSMLESRKSYGPRDRQRRAMTF